MKNKESVKNLIIALIFGVIAFLILLFVNNRISKNEVDMIWSVKEIPQGTMLTEDNINNYVKAMPTNDSIRNGDIIVDKKELIGKIAVRDITTSELMQKSFFLDDDVKSEFDDPVLVSFAATDFTSTGNGVIRRGDHINVSKLNDKNTTSVSADVNGNSINNYENLIVEDAYVVDAFDSSGTKIEPGDKTAIATSFNIYIEKNDETAFYNTVKDKNIAVSKIETSNKK